MKTKLHLKKALLYLIVTIITLVFTIKQSIAQTVKEFNSEISKLKASENSSDNKEATQLAAFLNELQPTIYIESGKVLSIGETDPITADVDAASIGELYSQNELYNKVEFLIIRINDNITIADKLNLKKLVSFSNLKYVLFLSTIDRTPSFINSLILEEPDSSVGIYYLTSIPY